MESAKYYILFGLLLLAMAISPGLLKKLPFTSSIVYLLFGILLGHDGLNLIKLDALEHSDIIEVLSEITVIISLFTVGLKLRVPIRDKQWNIPFSKLVHDWEVDLVTSFFDLLYSPKLR